MQRMISWSVTHQNNKKEVYMDPDTIFYQGSSSDAHHHISLYADICQHGTVYFLIFMSRVLHPGTISSQT